MIERPYCYEGCNYSPVTKNNGTLVKDGKLVCDKYPTGFPFELQEVNEQCPVATGEEAE